MGENRSKSKEDIFIHRANFSSCSSHPASIALVDSGTTGNYLTSDAPCNQKTRMHNPVQLQMPNGDRIESTHKALLPLPQLPIKAREAIIFPKLKTNLLSVGTFCDNGCKATFDKNNVKITHNKQDILCGERNSKGLYQIDMANNDIMKDNNPDTSFAHHVYDTKSDEIVVESYASHVFETKSNVDLVKYYHQACWSPSKTTWVKAIKNNFFTTWPGLTAELVQKFLPKSEHTIKGHLKQEFKNQRSTKNAESKAIEDDVKEYTSQDDQTRKHDVFVSVQDLQGKVYTDQTGRFPVTSSQGKKYIMIAYDYDSNTITAESLKSRTGEELRNGYRNIHKRLVDRGLKPKMHILDNECASSFKEFMKSMDESFQLVPPHIHRRNAAERAIQTFKNHLIAGLTSVHPDFPMHLWCRMIEHAEITLNLLRPSRINPKLSAYAQLNGAFDYNATPLAPPGTKVIIHTKPVVRGTWDTRGLDA